MQSLAIRVKPMTVQRFYVKANRTQCKHRVPLRIRVVELILISMTTWVLVILPKCGCASRAAARDDRGPCRRAGRAAGRPAATACRPAASTTSSSSPAPRSATPRRTSRPRRFPASEKKKRNNRPQSGSDWDPKRAEASSTRDQSCRLVPLLIEINDQRRDVAHCDDDLEILASP